MVREFYRQQKKLIVQVLCTLVIAVTLLLVLYMFLSGKEESNRIDMTSLLKPGKNWMIDGTALKINDSAASVWSKVGEQIKMECEIPDEVDDSWGAMIYAEYCHIKAFINGQQIYEYGDDSRLPFGHMVGNVRVFIPVESTMKNETLTIVMTPYYSMHMDVPRPMFGEKTALWLSVLKDSIFKIIIIIFLILMMAVATVFSLAQKRRRIKEDAAMSGYFILFMMCVTFWLICSSDIPQFITNRAEAVSLVSFLSLSFMCIPLNGFGSLAVSNGRKQFEFLYRIGWILPIINIICFMTDICDPMTLLPATHVYIAVTVAFMFIFSIRGLSVDKDSRIFLQAMIILAVSAALGLVCFFVAPSKGYDGIALGVGFLFFFASILYMIIRRQFENFNNEKDGSY